MKKKLLVALIGTCATRLFAPPKLPPQTDEKSLPADSSNPSALSAGIAQPAAHPPAERPFRYTRDALLNIRNSGARVTRVQLPDAIRKK